MQFPESEHARRNKSERALKWLGLPTSSPLCLTSAHAPHVHTSWPSGLASRAVRLSDNKEEALKRVIFQYANVACDPRIVDRFILRASTKQNFLLASPSEPCVTCVLKYHPLLRHAINAALSYLHLERLARPRPPRSRPKYHGQLPW